MEKQEIIKREIRAYFKKEEHLNRDSLKQQREILSHDLMRISRNAILFVILVTPFLDILAINFTDPISFLYMLMYSLFMLLLIVPVIYSILALVFIKK